MLRRRLVALVVLALLPLTAVGLLAGASPASAKIIRIKAPTLVGPAPIGNEVIGLTGNLGRSVIRPVKLQRRYGGLWHTVAMRTIGRKGHYAFSIAMPGSTAVWRVTAPAIRKHGKYYPQRLTGVRTVYAAIQTANVSAARSVNVNAPVDVTMSFAPVRPGREAALQVDDGSGWQTVASLAQDGAGRATFRLARPTPGVVKLRAVAGAFRGAGVVAGAATDLYVLPAKRMKVAAHRGFSAYYPENTLAAYNGAINQPAGSQADWLETDWQPTKVADTTQTCADGTQQTAGTRAWIALHNGGLRETTNVETVFPRATNPTKYTANGVPIPALFTLCELKQLDAGAWKGAAWANRNDTKIPTLEQALDLVRTSPNTGTRLMVEPKLVTKPQDAIALYDALKAYDDAHASDPGYQRFVPQDPTVRTDRAVFDTFYLDVAKALLEARPAAEVAFIADQDGDADPSLFPQGVATILNDSLVTQARVDAFHQANQQVVVWTVNNEDRWRQLAVLGVDTVITDESKRARAVLTGTD